MDKIVFRSFSESPKKKELHVTDNTLVQEIINRRRIDWSNCKYMTKGIAKEKIVTSKIFNKTSLINILAENEIRSRITKIFTKIKTKYIEAKTMYEKYASQPKAKQIQEIGKTRQPTLLTMM